MFTRLMISIVPVEIMKTLSEITIEELTAAQLKNLEQVAARSRKWGFPAEQILYSDGHFLVKFPTLERLILKTQHSPIIEIELGQSPAHLWGVTSHLMLSQNGWGSTLSIYDMPYQSREEALQAEIAILQKEVRKYYPQDKHAITALKWLERQERELIQPDLFAI